MEEVLKALGGFTAIVLASVGAAYAAFRFFSEKWIENKFATQLADHTHLQNLEIQRLRVEIETLLNGALLVQQKSFELLPKVWDLAISAYLEIGSFVSPLQSYPDLDKMDGEELKQFLANSELLETQKRDIRNAGKKLDAYIDAIFWIQLSKCHEKYGSFRRFTETNRIFLDADIKHLIKELSDKLTDCISIMTAHKEVRQHGGPSKCRPAMDDAKNITDQLEAAIHQKIRVHRSWGELTPPPEISPS